MKKILIIEDEPNIRELVTYNLKQNGYEPFGAEDGVSGIKIISSEKPDLILLDIMLPGKDGFEILKELRLDGLKTPVIMLTAKSDEIDKVIGLELGADDYISKPFGIRELMARIKAVLRRYDENFNEEFKAPQNVITAGKLEIDFDRYEATYNEKKLLLTYKEFELLGFLAKNRGIVFTRDELLDKVWGINYAGETRTVDVHIRHLRRKMDDDGDECIRTVRGKGYKLK